MYCVEQETVMARLLGAASTATAARAARKDKAAMRIPKDDD